MWRVHAGVGGLIVYLLVAEICEDSGGIESIDLNLLKPITRQINSEWFTRRFAMCKPSGYLRRYAINSTNRLTQYWI